MKLLFLDVDGVLNSTRSFVGIGMSGPPFPHRMSAFAKQGKVYSPNFDPVAVGLLREMVEQYDFKIVLSSTWRIGFKPDETIKLWKEFMSEIYDWEDFPIIGQTPDTDDIRGREIDKFMKELDEEIEDFIIVDDDSDMTEKQKENNFHKTTFDVGLTYEFIKFCEDRYGDSHKIVY